MVKYSSKVRDVSALLQYLREILLGRKHSLHGRFAPFLAKRTIPTPDIPRSPEIKLSNKYYFSRSAFDSVKPPVVAPVAEGPPIALDPKRKVLAPGMRPDAICFPCLPTPGAPWWWDGHCYFECVEDPPPNDSPGPVNFIPPCPDPCPPPEPPKSTCPPGFPPCPPVNKPEPYPPPCPRSPDAQGKH